MVSNLTIRQRSFLKVDFSFGFHIIQWQQFWHFKLFQILGQSLMNWIERVTKWDNTLSKRNWKRIVCRCFWSQKQQRREACSQNDRQKPIGNLKSHLEIDLKKLFIQDSKKKNKNWKYITFSRFISSLPMWVKKF